MSKKKFKQFDNIICISSLGDFVQGDVTQIEHDECKGCGGYILEGSKEHYPSAYIELCFDLFKPSNKPKPDVKAINNFFTSMSKMLAFASTGGMVSVDHVTGVMKPYIREFGIEFDFFDLRPPVDQEQNKGG